MTLVELLRAVQLELLARADLTLAPRQPSGMPCTLFVWVDEDGTTDLTAEGAEWRRDAYHAAALQLGDAEWLPPDAQSLNVEASGGRAIWRRLLEVRAVVWTRDEVACARVLQGIVSAFHRHAPTIYEPVRDEKIGRWDGNVLRRLTLRLALRVAFDDSPFDPTTTVLPESAGVDLLPDIPADGVLYALETDPP